MQKSILIVEDESIIAKDLAERLANLGYKVSAIAHSSKEAFDALKINKPDLILMDIILKDSADGISIADQVKKEFDIPVVFLTAYADEEKLKRAKLVEPYGYILKPFEERELRAVIEMAFYKHQADHIINESRIYSENIVETIREPLLVLDTDLKIKSANKSFFNIFNLRSSETIGKSIFSIGSGQWDVPGLRNIFDTLLSKQVNVENFEMKHKIGSEERIMLLNARKISQKPGKPGLILLAIEEITEIVKMNNKIKRDLKEKEILLREVNHRVKNNLQIIYSLLSLQSRYSHDKKVRAVLTEVQDRIKSMSTIHESIYQSGDLGEIELRSYLKKIAERLFESYGVSHNKVKLNLDTDKVHMDVNYAIPISLIFNELLSNSLKYAFPKKRQGEISARFIQDSKNTIFEFSDNGVGLPKSFNFSNSKTLGLNLVFSLVEQLEGTIKLENDKGASFKIVFRNKEANK